MNVLDRIDKDTLRDLLGKGWLTHDGMWYMHAAKEIGIHKANSLNRAAIQSLAPIEVNRVLNAFETKKEDINSFEILKNFMRDALEITLPASIFRSIRFEASSTNIFHWEWESGECFAYKGMKMMGLLDDYCCGVMYRIECWLNALDVRYTIEPKIDRCIMHASGACSGDIRVYL